MTKLRAYKTGDADQIPKRAEDLQRRWHETLIILSDAAVTLTDDDGNVQVVMATVMLWPGVADFVSLVHPEPTVPVITLVRDTRKVVEDYCQVMGVTRCNADAYNDDQLKWMRALGFVEEGKRERFGPQGQDVHIMVKWYRLKKVEVKPKEEWGKFERHDEPRYDTPELGGASHEPA